MKPLETGDAAPDFETVDQHNESRSLRDFKGQKVILYFYPADDTPGCTKEACDFRDSRTELQEAGYVVLGVSPQGVESHEAFASKFSLNFPLLVDEDMSMSKAYGVAGDFGEWEGIPLNTKRSTFVIDADGNIELALYGVSSRGHVDDLRAKLGI